MSDLNSFEISANVRRFLRRNGSRSISIARIEGFLSGDQYTVLSGTGTTRLIYATEVLIDAPVGYYRFNEPVSSDPAEDSSGHAHDGSYTGGVTTVPGNLYYDNDTAMSFNGTTGYAFLPAGVLHTSAMLEGVFKIAAGTTAFIRDASTGSAGWEVGYDYGSGTFGVRVGGISFDTGVEMSPYAGLWTHVVLVKHGDVVGLQLNGVVVFTSLGASGAAASAANWYVMKDGTNANFLTGRADEISFYNTFPGWDRALKHYRAYAGVPG